jgi:hypothetical protein
MTDAPAPARGDSALVVPIPEAEPVVGDLRLEHDVVAARGVPAHVTVLFPFVSASQIDASVHDALSGLFAGMRGFAYRFERAERFDDTTVFLAPEPASGFTVLTDAVARRWPEHPPYGGAYAEVIPHLTIGDKLADGVADGLHAAVADRLASHGPVVGHASEVWLMTEGATGRWSVAARYRLATSAGIA